MEAERLRASILIDASHENSGGDPNRQVDVVFDVARRRASGESAIAGFILESYFETGSREESQDSRRNSRLSATDPCLGWEETERLLVEASRIFSRGN
jgi:3-deoxy-7-phosphoheptulonate synthase